MSTQPVLYKILRISLFWCRLDNILLKTNLMLDLQILRIQLQHTFVDKDHASYYTRKLLVFSLNRSMYGNISLKDSSWIFSRLKYPKKNNWDADIYGSQKIIQNNFENAGHKKSRQTNSKWGNTDVLNTQGLTN